MNVKSHVSKVKQSLMMCDNGYNSFHKGNFPHIMAVHAVTNTISGAISVNCVSKHNCFSINVERNLKSSVKCESCNPENYCGSN